MWTISQLSAGLAHKNLLAQRPCPAFLTIKTIPKSQDCLDQSTFLDLQITSKKDKFLNLSWAHCQTTRRGIRFKVVAAHGHSSLSAAKAGKKRNGFWCTLCLKMRFRFICQMSQMKGDHIFQEFQNLRLEIGDLRGTSFDWPCGEIQERSHTTTQDSDTVLSQSLSKVCFLTTFSKILSRPNFIEKKVCQLSPLHFHCMTTELGRKSEQLPCPYCHFLS